MQRHQIVLNGVNLSILILIVAIATVTSSQDATSSRLALQNTDSSGKKEPPRTPPCPRRGKTNCVAGSPRCDCDLVGSKSPNCDRLTGRCTCKTGYSGSKCDKCSPGYYNPGIANDLPKTLHCVECGGCFNKWHRSITQLKEKSVETIKKAYELNFKLTSSFNVANPTWEEEPQNGSDNLATLISFSDLENKIHTIGSRVLANKVDSDKIALLAHELNATEDNVQTIKHELADQLNGYAKFKTEMFKFRARLNLQAKFLEELEALLANSLDQEHARVLEDLPRGALKLIERHKSRSESILNQTLDTESTFVSQFGNITELLFNRIGSIHESKRNIDAIGTQIFYDVVGPLLINVSRPHLNELVSCDPLKSTSNGATRMLAERGGSIMINLPNFPKFNQMNPMHSRYLVDSGNFVLELASQQYDLYLNNSDNRGNELIISKQLIEAARAAANETSFNLDTFAANMTSLLDSMLIDFDHLKVGSSSAAYEFKRIVDNCVETSQGFVNRIDNKLTSGQKEMDDQWQHIAKNDSLEAEASKIFALAAEVRNLLEKNQVEIKALEQQGELVAEVTASELLLNQRADGQSNRLQEVAKTKQEADAAIELTRQLDERFRGDTDRLTIALNQIESELNNSLGSVPMFVQMYRDKRQTTLSGLGDPNKRDYIDIRVDSLVAARAGQAIPLPQRFKQLETRSLERRLTLARLVETQTRELDALSLANSDLFNSLADAYQEVEAYSDVFESGERGHHRTPNSLEKDTRPAASHLVDSQVKRPHESRLKDYQRALNVVTELEQISQRVYKMLGQTSNLREEFASNERQFGEQFAVIESLNAEMAQINLDIERSLHESSACV